MTRFAPSSVRERAEALEAARYPSLVAPEPLARTGEYTVLGLAGADDPRRMRVRQAILGAALVGMATALAILYALERYLYRRLDGESVAFLGLLPAELVFAYLWVALAPVVMWSAGKFPLWAPNRLKSWAMQLAIMVCCVLGHIALFTTAIRGLGYEEGALPLTRLFDGYLLSWAVLDAILFWSLVAVHHAIIYHRVSGDRAVRASTLQASLALAQLQVLRIQLQPHFLFNTLNSISVLMHKDVRRADSVVTALSDLLRIALRQADAQEVPLREELSFLKRYLEIMSVRFGERLRSTIEVDPSLYEARIPGLLLQPLVENAIRHGIADRIAGGRIHVRIWRSDHQLHIVVSDDGVGLPGEGVRDGVGLGTTRARLRHLYGDAHFFDIRNNHPSGARVTAVIPFGPAEELPRGAA